MTKVGRVKTEKWHNYEEGDTGAPIDNYFKKGFWKRNDKKRFLKKFQNRWVFYNEK